MDNYFKTNFTGREIITFGLPVQVFLSAAQLKPPQKNRMKESVVDYIKTSHVTRPTGLKICLSFRVNGHLPTLDDITCR